MPNSPRCVRSCLSCVACSRSRLHLQLKERMLEKKKVNAKKELEDQKANAAIQRKQGKDSAAIKAEMELKEAQKAAIERKAGPSLVRSSM